jgi:hypothetical protein
LAVRWRCHLERNATGVDGDGEGEERAALVLPGGETDDLTDGRGPTH